MLASSCIAHLINLSVTNLPALWIIMCMEGCRFIVYVLLINAIYTTRLHNNSSPSANFIYLYEDIHLDLVLWIVCGFWLQPSGQNMTAPWSPWSLLLSVSSQLVLLTDLRQQRWPEFPPDLFPKLRRAPLSIRANRYTGRQTAVSAATSTTSPPPLNRPLLYHVWHGGPQSHIALWDPSAFPQQLCHPILPLLEREEPGVGGRKGAAPAARTAQPTADQTHPHILCVRIIRLFTKQWEMKSSHALASYFNVSISYFLKKKMLGLHLRE